MENTDYNTYMKLIDSSELNFFTTYDEGFYYIASEDIEDGQVILAKFNTDGDLINIMADLSVNSLDEFINRYSK